MARFTEADIAMLAPEVQQQIRAQLPPPPPMPKQVRADRGMVEVTLSLPKDSLIVRRGGRIVVVFRATADDAAGLAVQLMTSSGEAR